MLALSRADYISVEGFQGTDCDGPHNSEWAVGGAEAAAVQSAPDRSIEYACVTFVSAS